MRLTIESVFVGIKVVAPYFDKLHHAGQVYTLKQEEYVFTTHRFRQPPGSLLDLVLRHELIDFSEMVFTERDQLQSPSIPSPACMIGEDLRNERVQADATLLSLFFKT